MGQTLWNVTGSMSTHDLVARIKASARQRRAPLSDSGDAASASPAPEANEGEVVAADQAEVNQILLQSLELVTDELTYLQTQVELVEAWVREETERSARLHQARSEELSQVLRRVADLSARVGALEDGAAVSKATRRLSWPGFVRLVRRPRQP